jgi:hypothetical protein
MSFDDEWSPHGRSSFGHQSSSLYHVSTLPRDMQSMSAAELSQVGKGRVVFEVEIPGLGKPWNIVFGGDGEDVHKVTDQKHAQRYYKRHSEDFKISAFFWGRDVTEDIARFASYLGDEPVTATSFDSRRRPGYLGGRRRYPERSAVSGSDDEMASTRTSTDTPADLPSKAEMLERAEQYCDARVDCSARVCQLYPFCLDRDLGPPVIPEGDIVQAYALIKDSI